MGRLRVVRANDSAYAEVVGRFTDDEVDRVENRVRRLGRTLFAVESVAADGKYILYQDPRLRGELKQGFLRRIGEAEEGLQDLSRQMAAPSGRQIKRQPIEDQVSKVLGGVAVYFTWSVEGTKLTWSLKADAVQRHLQGLGRVVLHCTTESLAKDELVHAYLDKDEVEKVWRLGKGGMGLTGIKHYKRDRVVAYLFVCYLAYLLWAILRQRLLAAGFDLSVDKALDHLHRVQVVRLMSAGQELLQTPRPIKVEQELYAKLGLEKWKRTKP